MRGPCLRPRHRAELYASSELDDDTAFRIGALTPGRRLNTNGSGLHLFDELPLDAAAAPSVHASVVLVRGRTHHRTDAAGIETGRPLFKMGYAFDSTEATSDASPRRHSARSSGSAP